ncbi:hypothetical protein FQN55_002099 [Onygenales sp. PD_40]|nr:hypothetical protein FQN55_002099 [Onygenales sp. PD_40]
MADFPTLQPAFTIQVKINLPTAVDSVTRGRNLRITFIPSGETPQNDIHNVIEAYTTPTFPNPQPMVSGTVKSEATFPQQFNGEFIGNGNDYIYVDPDGKRLRLDAHGAIQTGDGATVYLHYTGIVDMTPDLANILEGTSESVVTPFGNSYIHLNFQTGDEKYAFLETTVWVGAGHFIYEKGQQPIVEYKVSKVSSK